MNMASHEQNQGPRSLSQAGAIFRALKPALNPGLCMLALAVASLLGATQAQAFSAEAQALDFAHQVMASGNAAGLAFAVVDKPSASIFVFDRQGRLKSSSKVIVGQARGDQAPADIGTRPFARIQATEKITSAGRFLTEAGTNTQGEDITWLDYEGALSMHRVRNVAGENRFNRIRSDDPQQRRISYGCVNVPAGFYDRHIRPEFHDQPGVIYVLPENGRLRDVFPFMQR